MKNGNGGRRRERERWGREGREGYNDISVHGLCYAFRSQALWAGEQSRHRLEVLVCSLIFWRLHKTHIPFVTKGLCETSAPNHTFIALVLSARVTMSCSVSDRVIIWWCST